jgi:DNA-binding CsgD family transcriptional regulator
MRRGPPGGLADLATSRRPSSGAVTPAVEPRVEQARAAAAIDGRQLLRAVLGGHATAADAVEALLDALGPPALIFDAAGTVAHLNDAGRALLVRARARVEEQLRESLAGRDAAFRTVRLGPDGLGPFHLAVLRDDPPDSGARLETVRARWGLTPKQAEVVALLAEGKCNKTIAEALGCAEATVELHVTAILSKARCARRTELVARFWTHW